MSQADPSKEHMSECRAGQILDLANWAAAEYATCRRETVLDIARAAAEAGAVNAEHYAEWAHRETGFGVVEHKTIKNRLCSKGIFDCYKDEDFVSHRVDDVSKTIEVPKPAGVVFALAPSTNPVATVFFETILCLLTRNSIIVGPHPAALQCCTHAARTLADAAEEAGAPKGTIQVLPGVELEMINHIMSSPKVGVVLATGGIRTPALEVGPGNTPAYVDASADAAHAAKCLADSKSFDNGILCANESAVIAHKDIAEGLKKSLVEQGCHICSTEERDRLTHALFPLGSFNAGLLGKSAAEIAAAADIEVAQRTRVLVAPLERIGDDYPLSREKPCPVLGYFEVPGWRAGVQAAQSVLRYSGARHSGALHARDTEVILRFGAALNVLRVAVNSPCSAGASGFDTQVAASMTVGTGIFGRSAVAENLEPQHLVNWTKIAFDQQAQFDAQSFASLSTHEV